jgi:hypothetical protein
MKSQQVIRDTASVQLVASPGICVRSSDHPCRNRIHFDVPKTREPTLVVWNEACPITAFPECARSMMSGVEVANIAPTKRLHHSRQRIFFLSGHQDVNVRRHQRVSVQRYAAFTRRLAEEIQILPAVAIISKHVTPIVSSVRHMMTEAWNELSARCHAMQNARTLLSNASRD